MNINIFKLSFWEKKDVDNLVNIGSKVQKKLSLAERIELSHEQEKGYNKEMSSIDNQIKQLRIRKTKLARLVSKTMLHRNRLIKSCSE